MNLILFGFKGCGKTYFGKRLAEKLERPFIDTDALLPSSPKELYRKLGERDFRACEKKALSSLQTVQHSILAVGGGTVLDPENVSFLQTLGTLVYLKASPAGLKERLLQREFPALFDSETSLVKLLHERLPLYEAIPAHRIDLEALDEAGVLAALQSILVGNGV